MKDIALVKLKSKMDYLTYTHVRPICLPYGGIPNNTDVRSKNV